MIKAVDDRRIYQSTCTPREEFKILIGVNAGAGREGSFHLPTGVLSNMCYVLERL